MMLQKRSASEQCPFKDNIPFRVSPPCTKSQDPSDAIPGLSLPPGPRAADSEKSIHVAFARTNMKNVLTSSPAQRRSQDRTSSSELGKLQVLLVQQLSCNENFYFMG